MKKSNIQSGLFYALLLLGWSLIFVSCKKDKDSYSGETKLEFVIGGSEEAIRLTASTPNLVGINGDENPISINSSSVTKVGKGFEFETNSIIGAMDPLKSQDSKNSLLGTKYAATTPMETGKTFRLLFRKVGSTAWTTSVQSKVGGIVSIPVTEGETYEYIAFSYNDDSNISDPVSSNNYEISSLSNKDLLWAKKNITINHAGTTYEKIHFYHKVALVSVQLDMSLFSGSLNESTFDAELVNIKYNNANNSKDGFLYTSTLDLLTGNLSNPVAYAPSEILEVSDPTLPGKRKTEFYTSNVAGFQSFTIKIKKLEVSGVDLVAGEGVASLDFNYNFTPASGRPAISEGHRLLADLYLMKTLPAMYALSGDSIHTLLWTGGYSASAPWLSSSQSVLGVPGYNGRSHVNLGADQLTVYFSNRGIYPGATGYMRTNFATVAPGGTDAINTNRLYYTRGKIKTVEFVKSDLFETRDLGKSGGRGDLYTLATQLQSGRARPDVIILSHQGVNLTTADNDALIDYVKNRNGSVIIMADRSNVRTLGNPIENSDATSLRFLRAIFGSGPTDNTINIGRNNNSTNTSDATIYYFRLKTDVFDPILSGFYGYLGGTYWGARGDFSYVTGLNESQIINLSDNTPANSNSFTIPPDAKVMFKHKTYNVFWVGDSQFITNNSSYSVSYNTANNSAGWRFPQTYSADGYLANNSKIFGNFIVNSFVLESLRRP